MLERKVRGHADLQQDGPEDHTGQVSLLTLYGAGAVTLMLIAYALEARAAGWVLVFALACAASSVYGWLAGAWPFGVVEAVWAGVALRRWWARWRGASA